MHLSSTIFMYLVGIWFIISPVFVHAINDFFVHFHSGEIEFSENIENFISQPDMSSQRIDDHVYRYLQFYQIPSRSEQESMLSYGIELHYYIPNNTFLAKIPVSLDLNKLRTWGVRSVVIPTTTEKVSQRLVSQSLPDWAIDGDQISLNVQYHQDLSLKWVSQKIRECGYEILESEAYTQFVIVKLPIDNIYDLADLAFVNFVEPIDGP
ncbi:MAG: hypothetical protein KDE33_20400, partial [Bacteroidetes bacterium]|nr:hypothetical protein [Bacteroidota bacterium]